MVSPNYNANREVWSERMRIDQSGQQPRETLSTRLHRLTRI